MHNNINWLNGLVRCYFDGFGYASTCPGLRVNHLAIGARLLLLRLASLHRCRLRFGYWCRRLSSVSSANICCVEAHGHARRKESPKWLFSYLTSWFLFYFLRSRSYFFCDQMKIQVRHSEQIFSTFRNSKSVWTSTHFLTKKHFIYRHK